MLNKLVELIAVTTYFALVLSNTVTFGQKRLTETHQIQFTKES